MPNPISELMADMEAVNGKPFENPRKELKPIKDLLSRYDHATLLKAYAIFSVERKQGLATTPYAFSFVVDSFVARLAKDDAREKVKTGRHSFYPVNPDEVLWLEELLRT